MMATGAMADVVGGRVLWRRTVYSLRRTLPPEWWVSDCIYQNVKDTAVGDTVTDAEKPCAEPPPGYKKVRSPGVLRTLSRGRRKVSWI